MKIESVVLKRLGPIPFWRGSGKCLDELQRIYKKATESAAVRLGRVGEDGRVNGITRG